jgi:hypothetical protein
MKYILIALALVLVAVHVQAQSDEEFVQAVSKEFKAHKVSSILYGQATTKVLVDNGKVSVYESSGVPELDAEAVRAANAVLTSSVQGKLVFPVTVRAAAIN